MDYKHKPHPHIAARKKTQAPHVEHERVGFTGWLGLRITLIVGTMWVAGLFALIALVSFPSAIKTGDSIVIIAWIAQTFLQLVLLPIIIVGQNVQAKASDKRADATYKDAEMVLHECLELQRHLEHQDKMLEAMVTKRQPKA